MYVLLSINIFNVLTRNNIINFIFNIIFPILEYFKIYIKENCNKYLLYIYNLFPI